MLHYLKRLFISRKEDQMHGRISPNEEQYKEVEKDSSSMESQYNKELITKEVQHLLREKAKILHAKGLRLSNESLDSKHMEINKKLEALGVYHKNI